MLHFTCHKNERLTLFLYKGEMTSYAGNKMAAIMKARARYSRYVFGQMTAEEAETYKRTKLDRDIRLLMTCDREWFLAIGNSVGNEYKPGKYPAPPSTFATNPWGSGERRIPYYGDYL
jgi:hypothetical protein